MPLELPRTGQPRPARTILPAPSLRTSVHEVIMPPTKFGGQRCAQGSDQLCVCPATRCIARWPSHSQFCAALTSVLVSLDRACTGTEQLDTGQCGQHATVNANRNGDACVAGASNLALSQRSDLGSVREASLQHARSMQETLRASLNAVPNTRKALSEQGQ